MNEANTSSNLNDANVFEENDSGVNSTDEFFDELDKKVSAENAGELYKENTPRVTQPNKGDSEQVTHQQNAVGSNKNAGNWDNENNPYKKEA